MNGVGWYGHVLSRDDNSVLRVALNLEVSGKRSEEDLEEASGRGDRKDWFEERGCPEMRQVQGRSLSNCRRNGVNPAISVKRTTLDKN